MSQTLLSRVRVVLVEPAGPLNVGSVARIMKNMGLHQLVLVKPHCDPLSEQARLMAVHAVDILERVQQVGSLPEALQGCQRAIATTARTRTLPTQLESPRVALPWLLAENMTSAIIFGPEERGLSNLELNYAQRFVFIRADPDYPSLNLAQAVAVCAYELYQAYQQRVEASDFPCRPESQGLSEDNLALPPPTSLDILEGYYQHLEAVLLKIDYLYPHTAAARMKKLRRIYNRASLSSPEVAMLRGILRKMELAMKFPSQ